MRRTIPVDVDYDGRVSQRSFMTVRWWQRPGPYVAAVDIRCEGADDWERLEGTVTQFTDWLGRLVGVWVAFDVPCDGWYADNEFLGYEEE